MTSAFAHSSSVMGQPSRSLMAMASVWTGVCRSRRFQSVLPFSGTKVPSAFFWYGRPSTSTARALALFIAPLLPLVSLPRRNDPENLATFGEGDVEDAPLDLGEDVVANLAIVLAVIPDHLPGRIDKAHQHVGEIDTALGDILAALGRIPVERHVQIWTYLDFYQAF